MDELREFPGAQERPGDSNVRITATQETFRIDIPSRGAPLSIIFIIIWFTVFLSTVIYFGTTLLIFHKHSRATQLLLPLGISPALTPWIPLVIFVWAVVLTISFVLLLSLTRPIFGTENIEFARDRITVTRALFWMRNSSHSFRSNVLHFAVRSDPLGLTRSALMMRTRNGDINVGANLTNPELEWLQSVGNAILAQLQ